MFTCISTRKLIGLTVLLLALASSGCSGLFPGSRTRIFSDNFSNPQSGWRVWSDPPASGEYLDGEYVFKFYEQADSWSWPGEKLQGLSNVRVEFTVRNPGVSSFLKFGVYCDYQDDLNKYLLEVSSNGFYGISKSVNGEWTLLVSPEEEWNPSSRIPINAADYRFGADCAGGKLALYIDGIKIDEVADQDLTQGEVRLFGGYFGHGEGELRFDNFWVGEYR